MSNDFTVKDSGERASFESGMVRDTDEGKARFDLLHPAGQPYEDQLLTRVAVHLAKGARKYEARNWEKATGQAELDRFKASAERHLMQWLAGERDEDHAAAVVFNLLGAEFVLWKMTSQSEPDEDWAGRYLESISSLIRDWASPLPGEIDSLTMKHARKNDNQEGGPSA